MNERYFSSFPSDNGNSINNEMNEPIVRIPELPTIQFEIPKIPDAPELEIEEIPKSPHWLMSLKFWGWLITALLAAIQAWPIIDGWLPHKKRADQSGHDSAHHLRPSLAPKTSILDQSQQPYASAISPQNKGPAENEKVQRQPGSKQEPKAPNKIQVENPLTTPTAKN